MDENSFSKVEQFTNYLFEIESSLFLLDKYQR